MLVIKNEQVPTIDATDLPIFFGGTVSRQDLVDKSNSSFFTTSIVTFSPGARNVFHKHTSDQLLFVTKGTGIVATESAEYVVKEGTTIHILAGEKHWHGSAGDSIFEHITVTSAESKTEILE